MATTTKDETAAPVADPVPTPEEAEAAAAAGEDTPVAVPEVRPEELTAGIGQPVGDSAWPQEIVEELRKPLDPNRVRRREGRGSTKLEYLAGHDVKRRANEIFGFGNWGHTISEQVEIGAVEVKNRDGKDGWHVAYRCVVRVWVRHAGGLFETQGSGYGDGVEYTPAARVTACELALKESECVPVSTRALTPFGFKLPGELEVGDLVAGYDFGSGFLKWTPILALRTYKDAPVVRIWNARSFDVTCTPDHDWVTRRPSGDLAGKRPFSDMDTQDAILCAAPMLEATLLPATPEVAARIGFAICDGTFHRTQSGRFSRFAVYQSKPETVEWCRRMYGDYANERRRAVAVGETPTSYPRAGNYPAFIWEVAAEHSQAWLEACGVREPEELPSTVARLSPEARQAMLDAIMLADGSKSTFAKKRKPWIHDVLRTLAALQGIYTGVTRYSSGLPTVRLQSKPVVTAWNLASEDAGVADVWCPQTETGTWVAQFENGVTTITGNTDALKRAFTDLGDQFGLILYAKDDEKKRIDRATNTASTERAVRRDHEPNVPKGWPELLARFDATVGREGDAEAWLEELVEKHYGQPSLRDLTAAKRQEVFQLFASVLLGLETELRGDGLDPDQRGTVRKAVAARFGGLLLEGPPWRLGPSEQDRPVKGEHVPADGDEDLGQQPSDAEVAAAKETK